MTDPATIEKLRPKLDPFYRAVESVLIGQRKLIDGLLIGLLTDGHVLLEGVPGLAKTLAVRAEDVALGAGTQLKLQARLFLGSATEYRLQLGDSVLRAVGPSREWKPGESVGVTFEAARLFQP